MRVHHLVYDMSLTYHLKAAGIPHRAFLGFLLGFGLIFLTAAQEASAQSLEIGAAKALVGEPADNLDGSYDVQFDLRVKNTGSVLLSDVRITDDLTAAFSAARSFSVISVSSASLTTNGGFDGVADQELLATTGNTLAAGAEATVRLQVKVTLNGPGIWEFENQATAYGTDGQTVSDLSTNGVNVDPGGNGPGDDSEKTKVTIKPDEYAIGDRVWDDVNQNGIQDPGEGGIQGVFVELFNTPDCSGAAIESTVSDISGNYSFAVISGTYCLQFSDYPTDYSVTLPNQGGDDTIDSDADATGKVENIVITSSTNNDVDMGLTGLPELTVVKTAEPLTYSAVDAVISYSYLVTNTGAVTLYEPFSIDDDKAIDESCPPTPTSLAPGESITCTATYKITQGDLDAGSVTNVATATGKDPFGEDVISDPDEETVTAIQNPKLTIEKSADPLTYSALNQVISYSYLVTNSGNVTLYAPFSIADDKATDESCPATPTSLAPGESITCTATYKITQADLDDGSVTNIATATGKDPGGNEVTSPPDEETVTAEQSPALTVVKTATPKGYTEVDEVISYSYVVTNTGNVTIYAPFTIDDDKSTDEECPATPTSLAPGESITCSATYTITQPDLDAGSVTNVATATGKDPNGKDVTSPEDDETVVAGQVPSLTLLKTALPQTYSAVGAIINYTFKVTNTGNVVISAPFTIDDDKAIDESCPATPTSLAPGESITCTATYKITLADLDAGSVKNIATATGKDPGGKDVTSDPDDETVTAEQDPALTIEKTADPLTYSALNQVISYSYLVTNSGNVTLYAPFSIADDKATDESCPVTPTSLAPGESITCTATYTITLADLDAGSVTNIATATGKDPAGKDVTSEPDDATVTGEPNPVIGAAKLATSVTGPDGSGFFNVTYWILVENAGNVTLTNVNVSERLDVTFLEAADWSLVWHTSGDFGVNPSFDGKVTNPLLLTATGNTLKPGEQGTIEIVVSVKPAFNRQVFDNQVLATGESPYGNPEDLSDNADTVDENGDGDPTNDSDPTPVVLDGGPLPLVLTGFDASGQGGDIQLTWQTGSESEVAGFGVEASFEAAGFDEIAWVGAAGAATSGSDYAYTFARAPYGRFQFRLRMVDLDGSSTTSNEVEFLHAMPEEYVLEAAYPNPFNPSATIRFAVRESQPVRVELFSALGQRLRTLYDAVPDAGVTQSIRVDAAGLASGSYYVLMTGPSFSTTRQIVLLK